MVTPLWALNTIKTLCSPKSGPKFTKITSDLLPCKTPHHAKFHRDQLNQLGEKHYKNWALYKKFFCHGQKHDYLSRASELARGTTKNMDILLLCINKTKMHMVEILDCNQDGTINNKATQ